MVRLEGGSSGVHDSFYEAHTKCRTLKISHSQNVPLSKRPTLKTSHSQNVPVSKRPTLKTSHSQNIPSLNVPRKRPLAKNVPLSKRPITKRPTSLNVCPTDLTGVHMDEVSIKVAHHYEETIAILDG